VTVPQVYQEPVMVKTRMEDPQLSLGRASLWNVILFSLVLRHCWLGDRKGIRPVKHWVLVCWRLRFDCSFALLVTPVVTMIPSPIVPTKSRMVAFWYRLTRVVLGKWPLNECGCFINNITVFFLLIMMMFAVLFF